ncbi:hypothetical protein pdam_00017570, partial [Pocillopora damicornis]
MANTKRNRVLIKGSIPTIHAVVSEVSKELTDRKKRQKVTETETEEENVIEEESGPEDLFVWLSAWSDTETETEKKDGDWKLHILASFVDERLSKEEATKAYKAKKAMKRTALFPPGYVDGLKKLLFNFPKEKREEIIKKYASRTPEPLNQQLSKEEAIKAHKAKKAMKKTALFPL